MTLGLTIAWQDQIHSKLRRWGSLAGGFEGDPSERICANEQEPPDPERLEGGPVGKDYWNCWEKEAKEDLMEV